MDKERDVRKMEKLQLLISLIEGTNDLIQSVTPDGRFEFVNKAWLKTLGYVDDELESLTLKDVIFPGQMKKHSELVGRILGGQKLTNVEVTFVTKDSEQIFAEGNMFPRMVDDTIVAATGFFRDVSERKKSEEKLSESRARTEFFVDCMVHDITNINQEVLSVIEILLMNPDFPEHLKDLVTEALDEVDRGSNLVENVRKISSLYSMVPKVEYHDLWTTLTDAAKRVDSSFTNKELVLETNISENQYQVKADEFFTDVFYSLLHNSVKFDTKKKVNVEVQVGEIKHTPFVRIELKDQGPGIQDKEKESLFDKISHRRDSIAGLGLGLSLVKMALDNYGAYINIEDRVEGDHTKGANFVILLRHEPKRKEAEEVSQ